MAWTKVSTTTNEWTRGVGTDVLAINGYAADGTSVLQEYFAFLITRGWTGSLAPTVVVENDYTRYIYYLEKTAVCEDGSSNSWGFKFEYRQYPTIQDLLYVYAWNSSDNLASTTVLANINGDTSTSATGRWSFWVSDKDSDSFAVIPGEGSMIRCLGFWPHSGDLFAQGYAGTNYPKCSGIKPLTANSAASWDGTGGTGSAALHARYAGYSSGSSGMNPQTYKLDYVWLVNGYDRPVFRSFGSDLHTYVNPTVASDIIFNAGDNAFVDTMKIGSNYYIAIGHYQKILLDCGTVPPVF